MLCKQNRVIPTDSDDNAGGNLRVVTFAAVAAQHRPFAFAGMHRVAAVTAKFMRAIKFGELDPPPSQLEESRILIQHLAQRSHVMATILAHHPHGLALPLANMQRMLADKIEINRFAMW